MGATGGPAARGLRTPRVAGAAGILFGLLLGIVIGLLFVATLFVLAASAGSLLATVEASRTVPQADL